MPPGFQLDGGLVMVTAAARLWAPPVHTYTCAFLEDPSSMTECMTSVRLPIADVWACHPSEGYWSCRQRALTPHAYTRPAAGASIPFAIGKGTP